MTESEKMESQEADAAYAASGYQEMYKPGEKNMTQPTSAADAARLREIADDLAFIGMHSTGKAAMKLREIADQIEREPGAVNTMVRVPQRTNRDCAVAALCTLTDYPYEVVRAWFRGIDFDTHGTHMPGVEQWLADHGYWYRKVSKYPGIMGAEARSPWPCEPFSLRHICLVTVAKDSPVDHWVCMDPSGYVIDPLLEGTRRLSDYHSVSSIIGIHEPIAQPAPEADLPQTRKESQA